ncbi:MAG: hypothetical protein MPJ24_11310 [Pirellulaceae bacterium]|nr:hypothetical protein [Pirellulaceae bacterium]
MQELIGATLNEIVYVDQDFDVKLLYKDPDSVTWQSFDQSSKEVAVVCGFLRTSAGDYSFDLSEKTFLPCKISQLALKLGEYSKSEDYNESVYTSSVQNQIISEIYTGYQTVFIVLKNGYSVRFEENSYLGEIIYNVDIEFLVPIPSVTLKDIDSTQKFLEYIKQSGSIYSRIA